MGATKAALKDRVAARNGRGFEHTPRNCTAHRGIDASGRLAAAPIAGPISMNRPGDQVRSVQALDGRDSEAEVAGSSLGAPARPRPAPSGAPLRCVRTERGSMRRTPGRGDGTQCPLVDLVAVPLAQRLDSNGQPAALHCRTPPCPPPAACRHEAGEAVRLTAREDRLNRLSLRGTVVLCLLSLMG